MEGRELRRSVTLPEQLSVTDSSKLEDLLKVREEDDVRFSRRRGRDSLTLRSIIAGEKRENSAAGRTLLDIIQQDRAANRSSSNGHTWKSLRDLLRHGGGVALAVATPGDIQPISATELVISTRPNPVLALSVSVGNPDFAASESTAVAATAATATATPVELPFTNEGESEENGSENSNPVGAAGSSAPEAVRAAEEQQSARVSLLALLEQTDRQWEGSGQEELSLAVAAVDEEVVAEDEMKGSGGLSYMCCVCMVRHKGAAFIPCGHTFCRLCSRELWVSRGNCPLCNGHILEILDIY
ncbi:hypothetical protein B296_00036962 [Ensete ventricosum]|uniref:RING-type domain-containing protein n=1 Tax=Ensete ventricosum TaxID=4639 RepID=A0A427A0T8_ENSVE|nr:hypothetical protein B296_00036962 [Ensete ventricosum]